MESKLTCGDCLEEMRDIEENSIDLIICDLPYGVTQNPKDKPLDLDLLWLQYKSILKDKGTVILTSQFPFTHELISSNKEWFKYDLIWDKQLTTGFLNADRMPLRSHEHILVFYGKLGTYNPQFTRGKPLHSIGINYKNKEMKNQNYGKFKQNDDKRKGSTQKYPKSIISIRKSHPSKTVHSTEKPIELAEYLIRTYSNEGDVVLDNCCGVGWSAVACKILNRNFIGIEKEQEYVDIARKRINSFNTLNKYF